MHSHAPIPQTRLDTLWAPLKYAERTVSGHGDARVAPPLRARRALLHVEWGCTVSVVRTASRYQFCRTQGLGWLLVQLVDAR